MTHRGRMVVRWAMRLVGVALIGFVVLTAVYARTAAPTVGESGLSISQGDTDDRYIVATRVPTDCLFTGEDGTQQRLGTESRGSSFIRGVVFSPQGQAGTLTCESELRVVSGGTARLAEIAEHDFLIMFPGVLLVAVAQVMGPRGGRKTRRS